VSDRAVLTTGCTIEYDVIEGDYFNDANFFNGAMKKVYGL
jgi:hypothetical protein